MDGRADIDGCVGAVQEPHRTGEDVCARHIAGAQIQPGGQDHVMMFRKKQMVLLTSLERLQQTQLHLG